jgi:MFS family permease
MLAQNTGVWIAMAAILVQAPRLVLAVLAADHQVLDEDWQRRLLMLAGFGTALVLTGGNLYLAHSIARVRRWRAGLVVVWLVVLGSTGGLVVPMIAAGIAGRTLPQVLGAHLFIWAWSLLAALAHEVTAAGCILSATALRSEDTAAAQERSHSRAVAELLSQRDAARHELEVLAQRYGQNERQPSPLTTAASGRFELPAAGSPAAAPALPVVCREGCGKQFNSLLAEMGHLRHCPKRRQQRGPGQPHG